MSQFRLNAKKPKNNAGLPTAKTELYLLYVEDIISMPEVNDKGILSTSDIIIDSSRRFHILYQTPSSQVHSREIEGDVDSRGFKKKISGTHPGDSIEINEFVKNNINQGFVILVKSCNSDIKKIYGSKCNPLYFTGSFTDDSDKKGYELTFEQEFADDTPVIFYTGKVLVDEDALSPSDVEFSSMFVKLDGSNITQENKAFLKEKLDIGELPTNIAKIDEGEGDNKKNGNTYTKDQVNTELGKKLSKPTTTISSPTAVVKYVILVDEQGNTQRMLAEDLGKNSANSDLETTGNRTFTQKHIYTHATGGFPYYVTGLPDKSADPTFGKMMVQDANGQNALSNGKAVLESLMASLSSVKDARNGNYDLNFSEYLVFNPTTRTFAKSDRPLISTTFNVPSQINIHYPSSIANTNYTPSSNTPQDIRDTFEIIKRLEDGYQFTLTTDDMWIEKTIPDEKIAPYSTWRVPMPVKTNTGIAGLVHTKAYTIPSQLFNNLIFKGSVADIDSMWSLYLNKEFPSNKDWIFRLRVHGNKTDYLMAFGGYMGFAKDLSGMHTPFNAQNDWGLKAEYNHIIGNLGKNSYLRYSDRFYYYIYFIKKGSKLSLFIHNYHTGYTLLNTVDYNAETMRYFRMGIPISGGVAEKSEYQFIDIGYWIQQ